MGGTFLFPRRVILVKTSDNIGIDIALGAFAFEKRGYSTFFCLRIRRRVRFTHLFSRGLDCNEGYAEP